MSHITYDNVSRTSNTNNDNRDEAPKLFDGQKLWFAHTVPQRQWLLENAKLNGATVVKLDVQADIKLVDHLRKPQAPGTYSYKYVESSIKNGRLENLTDHAVGVASRVGRPVGSTMTAPKGGRTPYTEAEDQFLWNWMKPFEDSGGAYKGNEIYKQIELVNPRHTYQSWRDRWLKYTRYQKREITTETAHGEAERRPEAVVVEPTVESRASRLPPPPRRKRRREDDDGRETQQQTGHAERPRNGRRQSREGPSAVSPLRRRPLALVTPVQDPPLRTDARLDTSEAGVKELGTSDPSLSTKGVAFTADDYNELYRLVPQLEDMSSELFNQAWAELAASADHSHHTPGQWQQYFETRVLPAYCKDNGLRIEDVAPYLFDRQQCDIVTTEIVIKDDRHDRDPSEISSLDTSPGLIMCTNCYTTETSKWRHDKDGKSLCNPCAVFLRVHGVPRPSNQGLDMNDEIEATGKRRSRWTSESVVPEKTKSAKAVSGSKYSASAFRATPVTALADTEPSHKSSSRKPLRSSTLRLPSFLPKLPALERHPESNESRKRSTGRRNQSQSQSGSQSQSTQEHPNTQSQSQTIKPEDSGTFRGEHGSTQKETHYRKSSVTAAPAFKPAVGAANRRQRLHDEPESLDIQQDSSLDTDHGPPREPPVIRMLESDGEDHEDDRNQDLEPGQFRRESLDIGKSTRHVTDGHWIALNSPPSSTPEETGPETDQFETARELSENWETVPEQQQEDESMGPARPSKEAQFDHLESTDDSNLHPRETFALEDDWEETLASDQYIAPRSTAPIPFTRSQDSEPAAGGDVEIKRERHTPQFEALPEDEYLPEHDVDLLQAGGDVEKEQDDGDEEEDASLEVDEWIALEKRRHKTIPDLEPILFKAVESTSFDFDLASEVVRIMLARHEKGKRRRPSESDLVALPPDMKGVWTETDDHLLMSRDTREVDRVLQKHGHENCEARFRFLGEFVEG